MEEEDGRVDSFFNKSNNEQLKQRRVVIKTNSSLDNTVENISDTQELKSPAVVLQFEEEIKPSSIDLIVNASDQNVNIVNDSLIPS